MSPADSWSRRRTKTRCIRVLAACHRHRRAGHAARRRHRQLRPGDAARRRRGAQPRRDERGHGDRAAAGSSPRPARCWPTSTGRREPHSGQELRMHPSTYNTATDRRLRRRRLRRRRLDQLGRPARPRQCAAPAGHDHGGGAAHARTHAARTCTRSATPTAPTASSPRSRCR